MARRTQIRFDTLLALIGKLPWWAGVMLALAAYLMLHSVVSREVTAVSQSGIMGGAVSPVLFTALATLGQYLVPAIFLLGAVVSA